MCMMIKLQGIYQKMKPRNKETLAKVYGFKKENIEIFGDYLIRFITKHLDNQDKKITYFNIEGAFII